MKLPPASKPSKIMNSVFVACLAFAAHGSTNVFNDAVFWFRGGKDINGDHYMQQGEFFDDLHANDASHANHNATTTSYAGQTGGHSHSVFAGNAAFATERVVFPALGNNAVENMQVLHISNEAKQINNTNFYFPFDVNPHSIFEDNNISNEYTIISRIRLDHDGYNNNTCFAKVGYDASSNKGMWFGFAKSYSGYPGCMRVAAYRTPKSGGSDTGVYFDLPVPTNTWVDLAVVVGNGKLRVGGCHASVFGEPQQQSHDCL